MTIRTTATCLLGFAVLAATAAAESQGLERLGSDVAAAIRQCPELTIFDHVSSRIEDGVVVLEGKVTTAGKRLRVTGLVARLDGVGEVRNEIAVLPASPMDDDLRYRVSRAIYGNPSFWFYAAMPHPPIHIIVEDGHVTLKGVVSSHAERAIARSLASGQGERSIANELRTRSK